MQSFLHSIKPLLLASVLLCAMVFSSLESDCSWDCHSDSHQESCQCICHSPTQIPRMADMVMLPVEISLKFSHHSLPEDQKIEIHRGNTVFRPPAIV